MLGGSLVVVAVLAAQGALGGEEDRRTAAFINAVPPEARLAQVPDQDSAEDRGVRIGPFLPSAFMSGLLQDGSGKGYDSRERLVSAEDFYQKNENEVGHNQQ